MTAFKEPIYKQGISKQERIDKETRSTRAKVNAALMEMRIILKLLREAYISSEEFSHLSNLAKSTAFEDQTRLFKTNKDAQDAIQQTPSEKTFTSIIRPILLPYISRGSYQLFPCEYGACENTKMLVGPWFSDNFLVGPQFDQNMQKNIEKAITGIIIEIDGDIHHFKVEKDELYDSTMLQLGIFVVRVDNKEVHNMAMHTNLLRKMKHYLIAPKLAKPSARENLLRRISAFNIAYWLDDWEYELQKYRKDAKMKK